MCSQNIITVPVLDLQQGWGDSCQTNIHSSGKIYVKSKRIKIAPFYVIKIEIKIIKKIASLF